MQGSREFVDLEAAIYEAAIVPELWPDALAELNRLSDTAGTAMVCINERGVHMTTTANMVEVGRRFVSVNPMRRFGEVAEVAALVAFLLSGGAPFINGAVITIDGGQSAAY